MFKFYRILFCVGLLLGIGQNAFSMDNDDFELEASPLITQPQKKYDETAPVVLFSMPDELVKEILRRTGETISSSSKNTDEFYLELDSKLRTYSGKVPVLILPLVSKQFNQIIKELRQSKELAPISQPKLVISIDPLKLEISKKKNTKRTLRNTKASQMFTAALASTSCVLGVIGLFDPTGYVNRVNCAVSIGLFASSSYNLSCDLDDSKQYLLTRNPLNRSVKSKTFDATAALGSIASMFALFAPGQLNSISAIVTLPVMLCSTVVAHKFDDNGKQCEIFEP